MPDLAQEMAVVRVLLSLTTIDVAPDTLRHGRPNAREPDVVGTTSGGEAVGFEATEVVDERIAQPRLEDSEAEVDEVLNDRFRRLTGSMEPESAPQGIDVTVTYRAFGSSGKPREPTQYEKRTAAEIVVRSLVDRGRGFHGTFAISHDVGPRGRITADVDVDRVASKNCTFTCLPVVVFNLPVFARTQRLRCSCDRFVDFGLLSLVR